MAIIQLHPHCLAHDNGVQAAAALLAKMHRLLRHAALACSTLQLLARHARCESGPVTIHERPIFGLE